MCSAQDNLKIIKHKTSLSDFDQCIKYTCICPEYAPNCAGSKDKVDDYPCKEEGEDVRGEDIYSVRGKWRQPKARVGIIIGENEGHSANVKVVETCLVIGFLFIAKAVI